MTQNNRSRRFVLCISNEGYPASLEVRKVYPLLPDAASELHGLLRVVDESGEDYLYPRGFFVNIELPAGAEQAFAAA
jgi:hypothetical protein